MKSIQLSRNQIVIVDDDDFDHLALFKWSALYSRGLYYAVRMVKDADGAQHQIRMHRVIVDAPKGIEVDHRDGDGLNNRRYNLRLATHSQNQANQKRVSGTSRFKGVWKCQTTGRWSAQVAKVWLGRWNAEEDAAHAYDRAARELYGEFAALNFPPGE